MSLPEIRLVAGLAQQKENGNPKFDDFVRIRFYSLFIIPAETRIQ
jgi:hypothetical protein